MQNLHCLGTENTASKGQLSQREHTHPSASRGVSILVQSPYKEMFLTKYTQGLEAKEFIH